jgi:hypothetical protein
MFLTKIFQQNIKKLQSGQLLTFIELTQLTKVFSCLKKKDFEKTVRDLLVKLDKTGGNPSSKIYFLNVSMLLSMLNQRTSYAVFREIVYEKLAGSKSKVFVKNVVEALERSEEDLYSVIYDDKGNH